jgi:hypothetical protein
VAEVDVLDEQVGDEPGAHRLAMAATRRFVTYLELLQPRSGETAEEVDVRVEVETEDEEETEGEGEEPTTVGEAELAAGPEDADDPEGSDRPRKRRVTIPDDPTVLSYLLAGIVQVESPRRQALLEAETTEARLRSLLRLIDREIFLLERRMRFFRPDARLQGSRRS